MFRLILVALCAALLIPEVGMARKQTPKATWEQIAAFYSGGNQKGPITYDWTNSMGTTGMAGSGQIKLNPKVKESLDAFSKYGPRSQQGMVLGALGLSTLIHESLHNRKNTQDLRFDEETAPNDLGWRLIPDMLQRYFGVPIDSKWGKKYLDMVMKQVGSR
ncbi:MAG: hypothetical protein OEW47_13560 [Thermoleophilia bacterium]|nr:hypothetical protein [Thermoleophilia bacterium]